MRCTRIFGIAAAAAFGLAANAAIAQEGYGSLSYFDWEIDAGDSFKLESETVRATGGYMFADYGGIDLGVEVHVATGGTDELVLPTAGGPEDAEAELNKMVAGFAKLNLPLLGERANIFGLAGYTYGRVDILAETTATTITENSFAWGAGADVALLPGRLYLTADYVEYINNSGDIDASAVSLGLRLSFSGQ